jgi:para-nitrobenzyl esterase
VLAAWRLAQVARTKAFSTSAMVGQRTISAVLRKQPVQNPPPLRWQTPMHGDAGAWHTAELAFCFDNTKRCEQGTGNTPEARKLARKMATAWANFARTGDPCQSGLAWTPFEPVNCPTMVFDNQCRLVNDPEGAVRKLLLG